MLKFMWFSKVKKYEVKYTQYLHFLNHNLNHKKKSVCLFFAEIPFQYIVTCVPWYLYCNIIIISPTHIHTNRIIHIFTLECTCTAAFKFTEMESAIAIIKLFATIDRIYHIKSGAIYSVSQINLRVLVYNELKWLIRNFLKTNENVLENNKNDTLNSTARVKRKID